MENILNITFNIIQEINQKDSDDLITFNNSIEDIIRISLTGSSIFKENPKDIDYFVLVNNFKQEHKSISKIIEGQTYDFFIMDVQFYKDLLTHKKISTYSFFNVNFYLAETVYGNFDFNYNIKDYEKQQKTLILKYLKNALFNPFRSTFKFVWWHYLTLKFINNQNYVITGEDKEKMTRWSNQQMTVEEKMYWKTVLETLEEELLV